MDVVILCGGKGARLSEETTKKPKPMVEIGGMAILWHIMKIYSYYGFKRLILALGYKGDCSMSILDVAEKTSDVYKTKYKKEIVEIKTEDDDSRLIISKPVECNIEKIAKVGFSLKGDMISEIERTIHICNQCCSKSWK